METVRVELAPAFIEPLAGETLQYVWLLVAVQFKDELPVFDKTKVWSEGAKFVNDEKLSEDGDLVIIGAGWGFTQRTDIPIEGPRPDVQEIVGVPLETKHSLPLAVVQK